MSNEQPQRGRGEKEQGSNGGVALCNQMVRELMQDAQRRAAKQGAITVGTLEVLEEMLRSPCMARRVLRRLGVTLTKIKTAAKK